MFSPKVLRLIDEINASVRSSQDIPPDNTAREHLLLASRQLVVALESPFEALRRFSFQVFSPPFPSVSEQYIQLCLMSVPQSMR